MSVKDVATEALVWTRPEERIRRAARDLLGGTP